VWHSLVTNLPPSRVAETSCAHHSRHICSPPDVRQQRTAYDFEVVCRPAFQAIIEALHQQMQQHLAAEKAAAAAASAAAAKRVSPFGAMSNLMKVRNLHTW